MKNIAATIIFDGAALNRDEKIGGNIQSIKKLNVEGSLKSFISRPAIRHYLFNTLVKAHPEDWKPSKVVERGSGEKKVLQFDITQDDILSSAELDAFGYMFTIEKEMSITRKAPVGITKAISIGNYNQDMVFYANHDLVQRANQDGLNITPNPFQREEHQSLYKLSFTIDTEIFGKDVWVVRNKPKYDSKNKELSIEIENKNLKKIKNAINNSNDTYEIEENNKKIGTIKIKSINNAYKITFELDDAIKKKRIKQILDAIHNGLVSHSSGEDNTIVPLFMIAGEVTVPSPVFHSYLDVVGGKIIGLNDCLNNSWLSGDISFIHKTDRLKADIDNDRITYDWSEFIGQLGLGEKICQS